MATQRDSVMTIEKLSAYMKIAKVNDLQARPGTEASWAEGRPALAVPPGGGGPAAQESSRHVRRVSAHGTYKIELRLPGRSVDNLCR